jgi:acetolactate synthase-like protein
MTLHHGGAIVGEVLARHGIQAVFTLCGGHISPILQGCKDHGMRIVDVRDERSAAFAADAYSRLTGLPGVCAVTAGPGVTNTMTAVKNAQMAQQPLIVLGGATATVLRGRGSLQDIDQMALMAPVTKWCGRCSKVGEIEPFLEKAIAEAVSGVPGPVFLELPVDILYPREQVLDMYMKESGIDKMKGPVGTAANVAVKAYMKRQFEMPHIPLPGIPRVHLDLGPGANAQAARVADALASASKPMLVIGNQAMVNLTPSQAERLAEAVRQLGIPTFLGGAARGLLGQHSDIQFRHNRSAAMKETDLCIVAGFPFDFRMGYGQKINRKATLVSINLDAVALTKNRRPDIAVKAHPGHFLEKLASVAGKPGAWGGWVATLQEREDGRDAQIAAGAVTEGPLVDPVHLFQRIEEKMSDDAIIIVDGGDFVATGAYIVRPRGPLSWLDPGVFGTLGVGGGFAAGAKTVRPDAEVWLFWGDGSSAYSLAEFDTYTRLGMAPIAVIGTDASWNQIARDQVVLLGDDVGTVLLRTAYHEVAEGYGGKGILVTDPSEIDAALDEAKRLSAEGRPVCINVHLAGSDFRKGSISI